MVLVVRVRHNYVEAMAVVLVARVRYKAEAMAVVLVARVRHKAGAKAVVLVVRVRHRVEAAPEHKLVQQRCQW